MRRPLLVGLLLAAAALRASPLTDNRFHPDEALYAAFGRLIATGRDPWLASVVVDKPPLPFYLMGGAMWLLGPTELAARLPSLFASLVSLPLLYALGRQLSDRGTAAVATLAFSLSPLAISFAPTAFLDPLQTALVLWAVLEAARSRWGWAGVATGLALANKQTTLAFVPLILGLALFAPGRLNKASITAASLARFLGPLVLTAVLITVWDSARDPSIGFWQQGYTDNVPGRLASAAEIMPRLAELARLLAYVTASLPLNVLLIVTIASLMFLWWLPAFESPFRLFDLRLAIFTPIYLAAYWLGGFNLWDRYFLILVPFVCLLLARGLLWLGAIGHIRSSAIAAAILACMGLPAVTAARSGYPIGGDHGAYDGIDQVANFLRPIPKGAVLYDHWLSWELRYYLDDAPIYLVWMPDPATLQTDLLAFGHTSPRYLVWPSWETDLAMRQAAEAAGFTFETEYITRRRDGSLSFTVYQLVPVDG